MASLLTGMPDAWTRVSGEYQRQVAPDFRPAARTLCMAIDIRPGDTVLDVACGPGTAAFVARELGAAPVIGVDFSRGMVSLAKGLGRERASFVLSDAAYLPLASQRFDAVISSFGLIFAPDPVRTAAETARVLRPQGRLALLAWHPDGSVGTYQRLAFKYFEFRPDAHDPFKWGSPLQARAWLERFSDVEMTPIEVPFKGESVGAAWRTLRVATGRIAASYAALDPATQALLDRDMVEFLSGFGHPSGGIYWPREALVIRAIRP